MATCLVTNEYGGWFLSEVVEETGSCTETAFSVQGMPHLRGWFESIYGAGCQDARSPLARYPWSCNQRPPPPV